MKLKDHVAELVGLPTKVEQLGVPAGLVEDLFMRRVYASRSTTISAASAALHVSPSIGNEIAQELRTKKLVEYFGSNGRDYDIGLTERGQKLVSQRMRTGKHVASMPVSLQQYTTVVLAQKAELRLDRDQIKAAFADMVIEDSIHDQMGPAVISDGATFLYGPPGTGKTSIAERIVRLYQDAILIPRLIEVDGELISVFDSSNHVPLPSQPTDLDPRFVLCRRPLILVGGELQLDMMDLRYDTVSGLNAAPVQMLANNGVLVIDDFGRQSASPDEILNRWIVPLGRGIDFLQPNSGTKFTVPFELKLVVSTNLDPKSLGDEAFLRRLRNKVYVGACSHTAFNWILVRAAEQNKMEVSSEVASQLVAITKQNLGELRPYVAIDYCELAKSICIYDRLPRVLDAALLDRVTQMYFVADKPRGGPGRHAIPPPVSSATFAPPIEALSEKVGSNH